jgi:DNA-binding IclR family transcriptional regulator
MIVLAEPTDLDTMRARSEFLEMPGLCVTIAQAARLLGVRENRAADILTALEREGFLTHDDRGDYRRTRSA